MFYPYYETVEECLIEQREKEAHEAAMVEAGLDWELRCGEFEAQLAEETRRIWESKVEDAPSDVMVNELKRRRVIL